MIVSDVAKFFYAVAISFDAEMVGFNYAANDAVGCSVKN